MAGTLTLDDKFHRKFTVQGTGLLPVNPAGHGASKTTAVYLAMMTRLRVSQDLGAGTSIAIKARLLNQTAWTTLGTITGSVTDTFDISTYDEIQMEVTTYGGIASTVIVSAFFLSSEESTSGGVSSDVTIVGNDFIATTPNVQNISIAATNTEYSVTLAVGTKKFILKHRGLGNIEFGFVSGLASSFSIPKGTAYSEENVFLTGITIYFESDKTGTLEVIEWS